MYTASTSTHFSQDFHGTFHSRKVLPHNPLPLALSLAPTPAAAAAPLPSTEDVSTFDNNVLLIILISLCSLVCSLGLNCMLRCAYESGGDPDVLLENRGIKGKALKTFPLVNYSAEMKEKLPGLDAECVICLSEFEAGESLRMLPKCNHGFHVGCIDKWLKSHSSCPKCRQCLIETFQKDCWDSPT